MSSTCKRVWTRRATGTFAAIAIFIVGAIVSMEGSSEAQRRRPSRGAVSSEPPVPPEGMVYIPGGVFTMGHPDVEDGQPIEIRVAPYFLDRTEVTVAAFAECVERGPCRGYEIPPHPHPELFTSEHELRFLEAQCTWNKPGLENHPMNCVTWHQAQQYCEFRGGILPTEAQWEFAVRGTDGRLYPWGNEPVSDGTRGNFADQAHHRYMTAAGVRSMHPFPFDDGYGATAPVGSYPAGASPFGVLDLEGNVKEWTADVYYPRVRM